MWGCAVDPSGQVEGLRDQVVIVTDIMSPVQVSSHPTVIRLDGVAALHTHHARARFLAEYTKQLTE